MSDHLFITKAPGGKWKASALRALMDAAAPGTYRVEFRRHSGRKTTPQNAYLHVLFRIVSDALKGEGMGEWTPERVKEWCKAQGCYPLVDLVLPGGEVVQVAKRTRDLGKDEAGETIDRVVAYWAEMVILLPEPNEQVEMSME